MTFHYCPIFKEHWEDLIVIIEENYSKFYNETDDLIILSDHHWNPISEIKKLYPNNKKIIVYQTEPLVEGHWWPVEFIVSRLQEADEVWDYDFENIEVLKSYGIEAKFRPFTYTEGLKRIPYNPNPDIDILFYGAFTPRRCDILTKIGNHYNNQFKIVILNGCSKKSLDEFIFRSKVILNINAHDSDRQKQTRIIHPIVNNKCVVSEKSKINYFGDNLIELDFSDDSFLNELYCILKYEKWKLCENCSETFKNFSYYFNQTYVN